VKKNAGGRSTRQKRPPSPKEQVNRDPPLSPWVGKASTQEKERKVRKGYRKPMLPKLRIAEKPKNTKAPKKPSRTQVKISGGGTVNAA